MLTGLTLAQLLIVLVAIILAMAIHEAMHGYVAHMLGDTTAKDAGRLTLNPLKHIDLLTTILLPIVMILTTGRPIFAAKPVPFNPNRVKFGDYGAALVALAGPFTNLVLAALSALALRLFGSGMTMGIANSILAFLEVNVAFFVFNMIPLPPLDGSRVLYAFAPEGLRRVMEQIEALGFFTLLIFFVILIQFQSVGNAITVLENRVTQFLIG